MPTELPVPPEWTAVDNFLNATLLPDDPALTAALADNAAAGLPTIDVAPNQGKFLHLLARIANARRILEVGTLGGYSTIWLARALPAEGRLVSLEVNPHHAAVAAANVARAGLSELVDIRIGPALDTLAQLAADGAGPFDFIFLDADKPPSAEYLTAAMRLARPGTVIVADNVIREGKVIDAASTDPAAQGVRRMLQQMAADPRLSATALQTVGSKGWDGFAMAIVLHN
jgi:predicted O-methyltransferase YrrM